MRRDPLFIVHNAGSGSGDAQAANAAIRRVLEASGREHEILTVDDPNKLPEVARHAAELALRRQGVLVAAGGDGAINTVARAALDNELPFGVIPQGTFNYFSRAHGIPSDAAEAAKALLTAVLRPTQVGLVNDRLFLVNASVGFYPKMLEDREAYKRQYGRTRWVALWAALATMLRERRQWIIQLEHESGAQTLRTSTLFIGANPLQLKQVGIPEAEALTRGQLVAVVVKPLGALATLGLLLRSALGQLGESRNVRSFPFDRMTFKPRLPFGRRGVKVAMDGEVTRIRTPLTFSVAPKRLMLLAPPSEALSEDANAEETR